MRAVEILFLLITIFSAVHAGYDDICPTSYCDSLSIKFPFKEKDKQTQDGCAYINLTCNATLEAMGTALATLPYAGDFYVRYIAYHSKYIQLYDPGECLIGRLMELNLSSSPFAAITSETYTFYTCPFNLDIINLYIYPIDCLSNITNVTVATALVSPNYLLDNGCQLMGSWALPVLLPGQFELEGIYSDLYLTWKTLSCLACEDQYDQPAHKDKPKGNLWTNFVNSPYCVPSFVTMAIIFVICLLRLTHSLAGRSETNSSSPTADVLPVSATATAAAAPQRSTAGGMDEFKISACTELVAVGESRTSSEPDSNTCPICLDSYHPKELIRCIAKCDHCFHAECIELWLRNSRTCPVCRTILSDSDL
ncbi:putative RING-H2 finger protein ATL21A [Sesamum alatum]|uniref:RING-type E3 ubiquitin transferase n=1 Tax=Sesamum alatum TaxID=300844 RepID=A0AAE2CBF8_9LAMI|nr:putative RING-H2 finger protein ATL21A [Sesamum alatum]